MPVDIRNFFSSSKKGAVPAKSKKESGKGIDRDNKKEEKIEDVKSKENQRQETSSTRENASNKKKRLVIVDSDDSNESIKSDVVEIIENESNGQSSTKETKAKEFRYAKRKTPVEQDRVEVAVEDYFKSESTKKKNQESSSAKLETSKYFHKDKEIEIVESPRKKLRPFPPRGAANNDMDVDDELDDMPAVAARTSPRKKQTNNSSSVTDIQEEKPPEKTPAKTQIATRVSSSNKKQPPMKREPPLAPSLQIDSFDVNSAMPEILNQYTFVFTGLLQGISRDEAQEMVKILGGRVTTAVSSKTDYLVFGEELEDGRPYTEGSKYKRALKEGTFLIKGEQALFGLLKQYNDKAMLAQEKKPPPSAETETCNNNVSPSAVVSMKSTSTSEAIAASLPPPSATSERPKPVNNPYARSTNVVNPYASKNPYAKRSNPINTASKTPMSAVAGQKPAAVTVAKKSSTTTDKNELWVDKYKPEHSSEILGNQDAVRKLSMWLATWEDKFVNPQAIGKSFSAPNGPWKAALLSGPPGIGKTTTATLVAKESGRDVLEFNASDVRSKKALHDELGDITGSRTLEFVIKKNGRGKSSGRKLRCIIMDEVDGMGAGDRSGISELIQMIKHSRVPIICICNDRQNQKIKSLIPYCMDLKYRRPVKSVIANRALEIASKEGLNVERNAAEAIVESCGNDVRQVLNCLHMWASNNKQSMTYKDLKEREHSINKDEILRVSLFDATRLIVEGRKGLIGADSQTERSHLFNRMDAFFVDYSFVGLMVQQNYLKVMQPQFNEAKRQNDQLDMVDFLERMADASHSMSDFAQVENSLREGQNWSLLPFTAALAVKTGFHAGGERGGMLPGFPEFTTWLGRNSTKGKKARIMSDLAHHLNFSVTGGTEELRLSYLPVLRDRFLTLLSNSSDTNIDGAIELMDEYGLDRDDVFEKLDEFKMDPKGRDFSNMDSKMKAAFTRTYNQGAHKSQALVAEQGGASKRPKRQSSSISGDIVDPDAIDDDKIVEEEEGDDEDDELDEEKIKAMFKKKGRGSAAGNSNKSKTTKKK